jgi:exosortase A
VIAQQWKLGLVLVTVYVVVVLAIFFQTAVSMVDTWGRMQTYNHGYLIVPITLWLIWDRRHSLGHILPGMSPLALPALIGAGAIWYLGALTDALVVQQFALVAMLVTGVWAILGLQLVWALLFPLAFLFFTVPVGDDLVPPLMEFTATFTVELLRLTGIPVYREGLYFSLPTGNWSVVQACSGIRYLIASVTLGCLFAYLTYSSTLKRVVFVLASIVVSDAFSPT